MKADQWRELTLIEQTANIGSEVHRVIYWQKKGDVKNSQQAIGRALELIDLTITDPRWQNRLKEFTRLREVFCDSFISERQKYRVSPTMFDDYFLPFALRARK